MGKYCSTAYTCDIFEKLLNFLLLLDQYQVRRITCELEKILRSTENVLAPKFNGDIYSYVQVVLEAASGILLETQSLEKLVCNIQKRLGQSSTVVGTLRAETLRGTSKTVQANQSIQTSQPTVRPGGAVLAGGKRSTGETLGTKRPAALNKVDALAPLPIPPTTKSKPASTTTKTVRSVTTRRKLRFSPVNPAWKDAVFTPCSSLRRKSNINN